MNDDTTQDTEAHWRRPHGDAWVQHYKDSATGGVRDWFGMAVHSVTPFSTVIDLGCHCGVLMPHILAAQPDAHVVGIDISTEALAEAKKCYPLHTWILASI